MTTFSTALRQHISRGLAPASAMRATWAEVRQGRVAPPPRHPVSGPRAITRRQAALMRRASNPFLPSDEIDVLDRHGGFTAVTTRRGDTIWRPGGVLKRSTQGRLVAVERDANWQGQRAVKGRYKVSGYRYPVDIWFDPETGARFNPTRRFRVERVESPAHFDPRSFRTVTPRSGVRVTVGCPKGKYDARRKRCRVGTRAQRVMTRKGTRNPKMIERASYTASLEGISELSGRHPLLARDLRSRGFAGVATLTSKRGPAASMAYYTPRGRMVHVSGSRNLYKRVEPELRGIEKPNPWRGAQLYDRVLEIRAQKGRGSKFPGQRFVHKFRTRARMVGLANGDILITGRR